MAAKQRARRMPRERGMRMTTIELPEDLLKRARIYAIQRGTSLRALVEKGLREVLARKEENA
jgi:hypothetical protein